MSWSQLCGWLAYYELEPWGEVLEDRRSGQITAAIYNVNRAKKSSKILNWTDFAAVNYRHKEVKPITQEGWKRFKSSLLVSKKKSTSSNTTSSTSPSTPPPDLPS